MTETTSPNPTSPNPTIDLLLRRKSIRDYTDQPISPEVKAQLLAATLRAPTAGNMTLYTIIEVQDQALKQRLAVTCDDQPFIAKAPLVLLFLADYQRWEDYYTACGVDELCAGKGMQHRHPQEGDLFLACCDALIAAQTAVTAADALGLGSCYIGDIMEHFEEHRQMFDLPRYVFPIALVCFGYPTEGQINRRQPERFEPQYVVFQDRYHHQDAAELTEMFRTRQERVFAGRERIGEAANFGQLNYLKKFSAEFSVEMTRSVRAILDAWRGDENSGH